MVLSGGGGGCFVLYGVLKHLAIKEFWNINTIRAIYATSSGVFIAVMIMLGYDWESLDDYLIKRPWEKFLIVKPEQVLNLLSNKGIIDEKFFKQFFEPLLVAKELSGDITMQELYDYTNIELHIYTTNINGALPTTVDISHKTYPDLCVYKAATMSSTIPILVTPLCDGSSCYIDGCLLNNFPVDECIKNLASEDPTDSILAVLISSFPTVVAVNAESSIQEYLFSIIDGMRRLIQTDYKQSPIKNSINCLIDNSVDKWKEALFSSDVRRAMIENGEKFGGKFLLQNAG